MRENEALERVSRMFLAHGRSVSIDILTEYAAAVLEADCQSCMGEVVEQVRREGSKVPPVSGLWSLYRDRNNSPNHYDHVGVDETQVDVGKLEAEWRTRGVGAIEAAGANPQAAKLAAARMWGSGAVTVDQAGAEWLAGIWSATNPDPSTITTEMIERRWDYARACATKDPVKMTDEEWAATLRLVEA